MSDRISDHCDGIAAELHEAGALQASNELIVAVEPIVQRAVRAKVHGDEVEDLVQEALIRLTYRFKQWRPEGGAFSGWAATIARNLAFDYLRRQKDAEELLGDYATVPEPGDFTSAVVDTALFKALVIRLSELEDAQAEKVVGAIYELVAAGDPTTHEAVAGKAGVAVSTVRRALVRIAAAGRSLGLEH